MLDLATQKEEIKSKIKCYFAGYIEVYIEKKEWGYEKSKVCIFNDLYLMKKLLYLVDAADTCENLESICIEIEALMAIIDKNKCFNDDCLKQSAIEKLIQDFLDAQEFVTETELTTELDNYYDIGEVDALVGGRITEAEVDVKLDDYTLTADLPTVVEDNETVKTVEVTVPFVTVLTANSTPFEAVPKPGAGFAVQVLGATAKLIYGTSAYTTNLDIELRSLTATEPQFVSTGFLGATSTKHTILVPYDAGANNSLLEDTPVMFSVSTGNPTLGNSDVRLIITYRIVNA